MSHQVYFHKPRPIFLPLGKAFNQDLVLEQGTGLRAQAPLQLIFFLLGSQQFWRELVSVNNSLTQILMRPGDQAHHAEHVPHRSDGAERSFVQGR